MSTVQAMTKQAFPDSMTHQRLRSACLGEMHARRLYLHAARWMENASLYVVAHAFRFTAAQEQEHADVFRGLLAAYGGHTVPLAEEAPLLLPHEPLPILHAVTQAEQEESGTLYPHCARIAAEEGYPRIAETFLRIAETEQLHARRFQQYASALQEGRLFRDEARVSWLCLPCGQLHTGVEPPESCTACDRNRGHFIRSSFYPFTVEG